LAEMTSLVDEQCSGTEMTKSKKTVLFLYYSSYNDKLQHPKTS